MSAPVNFLSMSSNVWNVDPWCRDLPVLWPQPTSDGFIMTCPSVYKVQLHSLMLLSQSLSLSLLGRQGRSHLTHGEEETKTITKFELLSSLIISFNTECQSAFYNKNLKLPLFSFLLPAKTIHLFGHQLQCFPHFKSCKWGRTYYLELSYNVQLTSRLDQTFW